MLFEPFWSTLIASFGVDSSTWVGPIVSFLSWAAEMTAEPWFLPVAIGMIAFGVGVWMQRLAGRFDGRPSWQQRLASEALDVAEFITRNVMPLSGGQYEPYAASIYENIRRRILLEAKIELPPAVSRATLLDGSRALMYVAGFLQNNDLKSLQAISAPTQGEPSESQLHLGIEVETPPKIPRD
ncbi:MAG: hypothetical protein KDK24_04575 [Pseudooceanicola sp.]|nr:hypothetical protein [Pseudooceanicola sp.]